jgi:hypothetical protein
VHQRLGKADREFRIPRELPVLTKRAAAAADGVGLPPMAR